MAASTWLFLLLTTGDASAASVQPAPLPAPYAASEQGGSRPSRPDAPDILVTGRRLRPLADVSPEIELGPEEIGGFGAGTIGELLDQLAPQTTAAGSPGGRPLVLINGQRALGLDEIRNLPPEAVLRIEILPEQVALRYGRRPGSKVVNLVLRSDFQRVTAETAYGLATDGGRSFGEARVNVARIDPAGRWSLDAAHGRESPLGEDERPLAGGLGRFRTLLPRTERISLGGSFTRNLSPSTNLSLTGRAEQRDAEDRLGPIPPGFGMDPARALLRASRTRSVSLGAAANGSVGSWSWSATAGYDRTHQRIETELPAVSGPLLHDLVRSTAQSASLELLAFGEIAALPAGPLSVTIGGRLDASGYRNRSPLAMRGRGDLSRRAATGQVSLEIPLIDGSMSGLGGIGALSGNLNLEFGHVSSFGTLRTLGAGLRWAPAPWLSLTVSASARESAPDPQSFAAPAVIYPNLRTFDFVTGETIDLVRIEGGNPDLGAQELRTFGVDLSLRPFPARNLFATAGFARSRASNPVGAFSVALPQFEAAFPERFERAADGRLVRIDARPVNFARSERDELRWGFTFFRTFAARPPPGAAQATAGPEPEGAEAARAVGFDLGRIRQAPASRGTLQLALYHTWRLRDRLLIREGVPAIDFLAGAPAGLQGGAPGHRIELQAALYRSGLGARLTAGWHGATAVRVRDDSLSYGSLADFDLRLFADLGERGGLVARAPWLRGTRIAVEVDNLFNARPGVRDESGRTPAGLQPSYLDPAGRSVRIVLRKLF